VPYLHSRQFQPAATGSVKGEPIISWLRHWSAGYRVSSGAHHLSQMAFRFSIFLSSFITPPLKLKPPHIPSSNYIQLLVIKPPGTRTFLTYMTCVPGR
jgi:hypothetical protein